MPEQVQKTSEAPHSLEAEQTLLGSILVDPQLLHKVARTLRPEHFWDLKNRYIFQAMIKLLDNGTLISAVTVSEWLRANTDLKASTSYLASILDTVASTEPAHAEVNARIIGEHYLKRNIMRFGTQMTEMGALTDNPHEMLRIAGDAIAKMNGSIGGGDRRIIQSAQLGSDLFRRDIKKPESIVGDGIMTESSFVLLYGRPGLGKTWLMLQMALAVAGGTPWIGIPTKKRRVAVIEMELQEYYLKERLVQLVDQLGISPDVLDDIEFICRPTWAGVIDMMEASTRDGITSWLRERDIGLLQLDAMSRIHFANESNAQDMGQVLGSIERIRDETGACINGLHHEPKEGGKDKKEISDLDAARGSSRLQSDPQTMMRLKLWRGKHVLTFAKMNLGPLHGDIFLERGAAGFTPTYAPLSPESVASDNVKRITEILERTGQFGETSKAMADTIGLSDRTVRKYLKKMAVVEVDKRWYLEHLLPQQMALKNPNDAEDREEHTD